jgi:hypothetical protein
MSPRQLSKVWAAVSLFLLYYALNTYLVTQGGNTVFGATLLVTKPVPAGMLGIPICSLLLLLSSLIGIDFARKGGPRWADRVPLVGFDHIDTKAKESKIFQAAMLIALSLVPSLSLIHFWIVFDTAKIATTSNPTKPIPGGIWDWSALVSWSDPARICTELNQSTDQSGQNHYSCEANITILPGLEPTVFAVLTVAAAVATVYFWWTIFGAREEVA